MRAVRRGWRDRALTIGAVLGSLCLLVAVLCAAFDVRPLVFRSGSMAPAIHAGALAFAHEVDAEDLAVGDVVSVTSAEGERVTHRIVTIDRPSAGSADRILALRGDANRSPDDEAYRVARADRVLFDVPLLGYVLALLRGALGVLLLGALAAVLLVVIVRGEPGERQGSRRGAPRGTRRRPGRRKASRVVVPVAATVAAAAVAVPAMAAFSDTGTVTSDTIVTRAVVAPGTMTCATTTSGLTQSAVLTFVNPAANQGLNTYIVEYAKSATGAATQTTTIKATTAGSLSFTVDGTFLGGFSGTSMWVRVYTATSTASTQPWKTTDYRSWRLNVSLVLGNVSCGAVVQ